MTKTLILGLGATLLISTACSRSGGNLRRDQQNYEVVQEGSASGVSSTISAPGETPPPLPLTGTNADTTTAFNLPNAGIPTAPGQPGTIAGTLPPPTPTPRPRPVAPPPQPTETAPMTSAAEPEEPAVQPPPTTDTAPPAEEKPDDEPQEKPPEKPPAR